MAMKAAKASASAVAATAGWRVRCAIQRLNRPQTTNSNRIAATMIARKNSRGGLSAIASTSDSRKHSLATT